MGRTPLVYSGKMEKTPTVVETIGRRLLFTFPKATHQMASHSAVVLGVRVQSEDKDTSLWPQGAAHGGLIAN